MSTTRTASRSSNAGRTWEVVGYVLLVVAFAVDLLTVRAYAVGMLYVPLVLLSSLTGRSRTVIQITAVAIFLSVVGGVLSPPTGGGIGSTYAVTNRGLAVVALVTSGWLVTLLLRSHERHVETLVALRATQRTLAAQHDLLAMAGEVGHFGGWSVDLADGRVHWSDEVARIHGAPPGYDPPVDEGLSFYAPHHRDRIGRAFELCARHGVAFDEELEIDRLDGRRVWVSSIGRAVRGPDGSISGVTGAFQDITERKEAQLAAERSLRQVRFLADNMPLLVWTATPEGDIDFLSKGLKGYLGVREQPPDGPVWGSGSLHPDHVEAAVALWAEAIPRGEPFALEIPIRRHDGEFRWHLLRNIPEVDGGGELVKWWGSATDVHDVRSLEEESRELARRLTETLESIGDAVLAVDLDWKMTVINGNAELLLDRPRETLLGKRLWDEFHDAEESMFGDMYRLALAEDKPVRFEAEYPPIHKWLEVSAYPHDSGLTIYFRDITEKRQLAEQVGQLQRLESLGQLTGGIAHDFNNLLTVILGSAEVLSLELDDPDQLRLTKSIVSVAHRGADLTHSLLAFARRQPLDPTAIDVNDLVVTMRKLLARTLTSAVELATALGADLPRCHADRGQLENALLNLCLNARDAMPTGGRLTLTTREALLDEKYAAQQAEVRPGRYVAIAVTDDGEGIGPDVIEHVFDPFFTTKAVGSGSGLGLAMVFGFVKQSAGHVEVTSQLGEGTTVTIYLPVESDRASASVHGTPTVPVPLAGTGETVLLVEHDQQVRVVGRALLEALGYVVVEASNGPRALELLGGSEHVDLMLTDLVMPGGLTGLDLAERARVVQPGLKVLFASGYAGRSEDAGHRLVAGVNLLTKPYGRQELAQLVRRTLDASGRRN